MSGHTLPVGALHKSSLKTPVKLAALPIVFGDSQEVYTVIERHSADDLPAHVKGSAEWHSKHPGYWIRNHLVEKHTAVEFLTYQYKDEAQYTHTGNSWFHLHHHEEFAEDAWMTRLSDQINNDNDFGLGHWSETDTQYSDVHHMMHVLVTTPEPLSIAATAPMDTSGLEYIGATMSAPAPPPVDPPSNGGSHALSGVPPPIFNGDRDKSELFLDKFMSYEIVNGDAKQFTTLFLKVALCLSYMNGPKIDSWARHRRLWLKAQKDAGVSMMDQSLWDDFEADFRRAYADQDTKLMVYQKLNELKMHRSDIDSHVAEFDRLIDEASYSRSNIGVLQKFKEGLQPSLVREVLTHVTPAPATLAAWKQKARERQTVYKELKNAGLHQKSHGGPTPTQQKWAQKLGLHNYQTPAQRAANPAYRPQYSPASQS